MSWAKVFPMGTPSKFIYKGGNCGKLTYNEANKVCHWFLKTMQAQGFEKPCVPDLRIWQYLWRI